MAYTEGTTTKESPMPETVPSAYVVTFRHAGEEYNVWVWPDETNAVDAPFAAEVNRKVGGGWTPLDPREADLRAEVQA